MARLPLPRGRPAGLPLGRAFEIPSGVIHDDLRRAVALAASVHGSGSLPSIAMIATRFPGAVGEERVRRGRFLYTPEGDPVSISIDAGLDHLVLTALHEIGHFLDLVGFGPGRRFESAVSEGGDLADWRTAVANSEAVRALVELAHNPDPRIAD